MSPVERAQAGFAATFGREAQGVAFAPGRVNLIGEHVDYNDGLVLPMALTAGTAVAWGATRGDDIEAVALDFDRARDRFNPAICSRPPRSGWQSYVRGMAHLSGQRGLALAIAGSIPQGSGLSSSASLCVGLGKALNAAGGEANPPASELAQAAQRVEHEWAGVRCGIMDQMAVAAGEPGSALLLDCRSLQSRLIALPADWAVMVVQSGVIRGLVDGHYNLRRGQCETAAKALGLAALRDADLAMIDAVELDPVVGRRARHVVAEIERVQAAVSAIEAGDLTALGALLRASHVSLRDSFEVSVPQVDTLVDLLNGAIGCAGGARMTGGGFGGAVVAVLPASAVARVRAEVERDYRPPSGMALAIMIEGAGGRSAGVSQ